MDVARNLDELKECVSVWGVRENRREHPRYQVDIQGNYYVEAKGAIIARDNCTLIDVVGKTIYIKQDGDDYLVGIQSTGKKVDIAQQLLG